jgi:hypothetical protein
MALTLFKQVQIKYKKLTIREKSKVNSFRVVTSTSMTLKWSELNSKELNK